MPRFFNDEELRRRRAGLTPGPQVQPSGLSAQQVAVVDARIRANTAQELYNRYRREMTDRVRAGQASDQEQADYYSQYDVDAARRQLKQMQQGRETYMRSTRRGTGREEVLGRMDSDIGQLQREIGEASSWQKSMTDAGYQPGRDPNLEAMKRERILLQGLYQQQDESGRYGDALQTMERIRGLDEELKGYTAPSAERPGKTGVGQKAGMPAADLSGVDWDTISTSDIVKLTGGKVDLSTVDVEAMKRRMDREKKENNLKIAGLETLYPEAYYQRGLQTLEGLDEETRRNVETLAAFRTADKSSTFDVEPGSEGYTGPFDVDPSAYEEEPERQKARAALRQAGYSDEEINQLIDYRARQLNRESYESAVTGAAERAKESPFWESVGSVPLNMASGQGILNALAQKLTEPDRPIDYYHPAMVGSGMVNAIRGQVASDLADKHDREIAGVNAASFLYQTGMSMADSGVNMAMALAGMPEGVGLTMLGGSAATTAMQDAHRRGLSDGQAVGLGLIAGGAEILTEKIGLDEFLDTAMGKGGKKAIAEIAKNVLAEGGEEVGSDVINLIADVVISREKSEWAQDVRHYMEYGSTAAQAFGKAVGGQLMSMGESFLGGALSGGVMGGGGLMYNNARTRANYGADSAALVQEALELDPENQTAQRAQKRLEQGKKLSGDALRRLAEMNEERIRSGETVEGTPFGMPVDGSDTIGQAEDGAKRTTTGWADEMGQAGRTMYGTVRELAAGLDEDSYRGLFGLAYEIGRQTVNQDAETGLAAAQERMAGQGLPEAVVESAYYAGREDVNYENQQVEAVTEDAPSSASLREAPSPQGEGLVNTGTEEGEIGYGTAEETGVRIRDGEQRLDGEDPGGSGSRVAEDAGRAEAGQRQGRVPADGAAASFRLAAETSTSASLIGGRLGSAADSLRLVTGSESESVQAARKQAQARGLTPYFYTGDYMHVDGVACRGFIRGKSVFIRADDPRYTADQIMRHEAGHDAIRRGEIDPAEVLDALEEKYGPEGVEEILTRYMEDYAGSGMSADEIWEELLCDSLGNMNVFADDFSIVAPELAQVLSGVKEETLRHAMERRGGRQTNNGHEKTADHVEGGKMSRAFGFEDLDKETLNNVKLRGGVVITSEQELRSHVVAALNSDEKKTLYMGAIDEQTRNKIEADLNMPIFKKPGQYTYAVSYDDIRHIKKHYSSVDEIKDTVKEIFSMLKSYDRIQQETLKDGQIRIIAEKRLPNAEYLTVNMVSNKRRSLDLTTVYITKKNGSQTTGPASSKSAAGAQSGSAPTAISIPSFTEKSNPQNPDGKKSRVVEPEAWRRNAEYLELAKEPEKNKARLQEMVDQAAMAAGYKQEAWHQTGANFTRFNTDNGLAGRTDTDTPTGLFFKPNADDIGIGGNKQMHVFVKMGRTLVFDNRDEAHAYWMKNVPGYAEDQAKLDAVERKYNDIYDEADAAWYAYYNENYERLGNDPEADAGMDKAENRLDEILTEWKSAEEPIRIRMKRKVTAYIRSTEYDSMHLKTDGRRYGKNVESFIIFDNKRVKSADPVTYDDNGNVIPLSERFNTEKDDIRFSRVTDSMENLQEENETLRQQVKDFRKALKTTERKLADARESRDNWKGKATFSPERVGREIIRAYQGTVAESEIHEGVRKLIDYAARKDGITYEEMKKLAAPVASAVVKSAKALTGGEEAQTWEAMKKHLRGSRIRVSQDVINDIDGWGDFWRRNGRRLNLVTGKDGVGVDVAYKELGERFGAAYFPEGITHPADQLRRIADVYDNLRPVFENPYSLNMAMAAEHCCNDLVDMVMGEVARGYKATYTGQLQEQVYRNRQYTERLLEKERTRSAEQVKALKEHWQAQRDREISRREDSEIRERLLKVARRLKNKKLPTVSRALLNQYLAEMGEDMKKIFAQLDTESRGMRKSTREGLEWLRDQYEELKDTDSNFIPDPATEERIKRLSKKQIDSLTHAEAVELCYALLNIEHEIRNEKKLIDSAEKRDLQEAGLAVMRDIENAPGSKASGIKGAIDRLIVTETLSPLRQVRRMVGYADADPLLVATQELADGQRVSFDYKRRAQARFQQFVDNKKLMERIAGKKAEVMTIQGIGTDGPAEVQITPAMKISLYLHSRNNQSLTHIAGGGIHVPDMALYRKGDMAEAYDRGTVVRLEPAQVKKIAASLSTEERRLADAVYDYFNSMSKSQVNAVSEKLLGYPVAEVENYFPINTDDSFTRKDFESIKFDGSIEGMGFLKERIKSASPIYLRDVTDVLLRSIDQHAKYVGLGVPVRNFNKLWGVTAKNYTEEDGPGSSSSIQSLVRQQWGETGRKYIEKMMSDLQSGSKEQSVYARELAKVRSHYAGAVLTLNASVAMKQAASYPTAAAVVGWGPLAKAMKQLGKVDLELINAYTPLQWYRSQGFSTQELGDMAKRGMRLPEALNWVQGADLLTTRKLWKAAEIYVEENHNDLPRGTAQEIREGKSPFFRKVAEIYNRIIEETQPNYTTMQRPQLLRSDDTLLQNLQMFKTQPFQNFNILYDAIGELQARERAAKVEPSERNLAAVREAKKKAAWAVSSQAVQLAVFAGMTLLWNAFRGKKDKYEDEDGDVTVFSLLKGVGLDMVSGLFAVIPFGGDVWELGTSAVTGWRYYGISDVTSSALTDAGTAIVNAGKTLSGLLNGKITDPNEVRLKLDSVADAVSKACGIPYENVLNLGKAIFRQGARALEGNTMGRYRYLQLTTSPEKAETYYDLLYEAYRKDPAAHMELYRQMVADGWDPEKIKSAMEARMKRTEGVSSVTDLKTRYEAP